MALKSKLTAAEYGELSEGLQEAYTADGDEYRLDVEPDDPPDPDANKLAKLNALLKKQQKVTSDLKGQLAGETKKLTDAEGELEQLREKGGDTDSLAAQIARLTKDLTGEREKREASDLKVATAKFDNLARAAATEAGIAEQAIPDVLAHLRSQRNMKLVDEEILDGEGTTLTEAFDDMRKQQPYFFRESKGGGTPPQNKMRRPAPEKTVTHADLATPEGRQALLSGKAEYEEPS